MNKIKIKTVSRGNFWFTVTIWVGFTLLFGFMGTATGTSFTPDQVRLYTTSVRAFDVLLFSGVLYFFMETEEVDEFR